LALPAPPFWTSHARITAEEVECYKTMDLPAFRKRWRALVAEARAAIARVDALNAQASVAPATGEAAGQQAEAPAEARARARAEARAALWDVGVRLSRTHHLLVRGRGAVCGALEPAGLRPARIWWLLRPLGSLAPAVAV
jgi:hypothetical protein